MVVAAWLGCAAGMAPDLDVFIQSSSDPLLFLEYHRHFTHSLAFIPFGAAIVATALHWLARHKFTFKQTYLVCLIGYATHGLLDACTTYGTQLFWPFSDMRVAWNNVSVVDPGFTLPLLIFVVAASRTRKKRYSYLAIGWVVSYLLFGVVQMQRATTTATELAAKRGHTPTELSMKPSFGNLLIWKSIYLHQDRYYVDGIRTGMDKTVCPGSSVEKLDVRRHLANLDPLSQQAKDLERFRWFSLGYLAPTGIPGEVADMRYSTVPNQIDPMWGITLRLDANYNEHDDGHDDGHVVWWTRRDMSDAKLDAFWALLQGKACQSI